MDGHGPCDPQRNLTEFADHIRQNIRGRVVDRVLDVFPVNRLYINGLSFEVLDGHNPFRRDVRYHSDLSIIEPAFAVVSYEHDFCPFLEGEELFGRVAVCGELAVDHGLECHRLSRKFCQFRAVDMVRLCIMSRQSDDIFAVFRCADAGIQAAEDVMGDPVFTYCVEDADEFRVLLAMDLLELDGDVVELLQSLRMEEIRRRIDLRNVLAFAVLDHRRQLMDIPDHKELHSSERTVVPSISTQAHVDSIQQIRTHHRYLVYDQQVERADDPDALLAEASVFFGSLVFCDELLDVGKVWT